MVIYGDSLPSSSWSAGCINWADVQSVIRLYLTFTVVKSYIIIIEHYECSRNYRVGAHRYVLEIVFILLLLVVVVVAAVVVIVVVVVAAAAAAAAAA